ncbi:MAG: EAL domain-containing protein [Synergistales bacterium]|nr:EAL domain-containing protein [Synergistales bacterium]
MPYEEYAGLSDPVLVIATDFTVLYVNPSWEALTGFDRREVQGATPPYPWRIDGSGPATAEDIEQEILQCEWQAEVPIRRKDGTQLWIRILPALIREEGRSPYVVSRWRDITPEKSTEQNLLAKAWEMQRLLDTADAQLFSLRDSRHYGFANKEHAAFLGRSPEELQGRDLYDIFLPREADVCVAGNRQVMETGRPLWSDEWVTNGKGERRLLSVRKSPGFDSNGNVAYLVCAAADVTEQRLSWQEELRHREEALESMANYDQLTGLPNGRSFAQTLQRLSRRVGQGNGHDALFAIDIDNIKTINSALGHDLGDRLIKAIAYRLQDAVREGDTLARIGGDNFMLLARNLASAQDAEEMGTRLCEAVSRSPFTIGDQSLHQQISVGYSVSPDDTASLPELERRAHTALLEAKGKPDTVHLHRYTTVQDTVTSRFSLEQDLYKALQEREFALHYQPHVDLDSCRVIGAEALLRWQHPKYGFIPPDHFIPILEETGHINTVGARVLQSACRQIRQWQNQQNPRLLVTINSSVQELYNPQFVPTLTAALEECGALSSSLGVEITETIAMHDLESVKKVLAQLKELGVTILIDDFGTGYSSLNILHRIPADIVKIDRSFISTLEEDANSRTMVRALLGMCRQLGKKSLAEGIETPGQLQMLRDYGCHYGQGYYFAKPAPAAELFTPERVRQGFCP